MVFESQVFYCEREDKREKSEREGYFPPPFLSLIGHNPLSGSFSILSGSHNPLSGSLIALSGGNLSWTI